MSVKKELYLQDLAVVFGIGVVHSFAYTFSITKTSYYNTSMMLLGFSYWGSQVFLHYLLKRNNYSLNFKLQPSEWANNFFMSLLLWSYALAPIVFALDFKMDKSEGALCFTFLTLSLVPYRYIVDSFLKDKEVEAAKEETPPSEDEDYPLAS